jgi:excisionase family DNA binding protein
MGRSITVQETSAPTTNRKEQAKMHTEIEPTWITYEEAQRLTSLGRTTLWRICNSGQVKTTRIGRAVRINRQSLEDYLERMAAETFTGISESR